PPRSSFSCGRAVGARICLTKDVYRAPTASLPRADKNSLMVMTPTRTVVKLPLLLVVGDDRLVQACRGAKNRLRVLVRRCERAQAPHLVRRWQPIATIVQTSDVLRLERELAGFTTLIPIDPSLTAIAIVARITDVLEGWAA